jgi:hypothetical protein
LLGIRNATDAPTASSVAAPALQRSRRRARGDAGRNGTDPTVTPVSSSEGTIFEEYTPYVTFGAKVLAAVVLAGALVGVSSASSPRYVYRDVALIAVTGKGSIVSTPRGIDCPGRCRALFVRGTHLRLRAVPAPGWRFTGFRSSFCNGARATCVFDMVSSHDCVGGACPTGVFAFRVRFVRDG